MLKHHKDTHLFSSFVWNLKQHIQTPWEDTLIQIYPLGVWCQSAFGAPNHLYLCHSIYLIETSHLCSFAEAKPAGIEWKFLHYSQSEPSENTCHMRVTFRTNVLLPGTHDCPPWFSLFFLRHLYILLCLGVLLLFSKWPTCAIKLIFKLILWSPLSLVTSSANCNIINTGLICAHM